MILNQLFLRKKESIYLFRLLKNGYKVSIMVTKYKSFVSDTKEDLLKVEKLIH